jgi:CRP/FNR family transcriptional activator FtrB
MAIAQPVSTFILAAVLKDAPYLMSGRTIESSEILMIPATNIRQTMETDTGFALAMVSELADRYRGVVKATKNLKLRSAVERLANHLLQLNAAQGGSGRISLPIAKSVLASLLGMTPENLSRSFATLRAYGVSVDGATITISKLRDLDKLAKPSAFIDDPAC